MTYAQPTDSTTSVTMSGRPFAPSFDPLIPHPQHVQDPYRVYAELREHAPMYRSPHGIWIASCHRDIALMLKDARFGRGYFYFENMAERLGPHPDAADLRVRSQHDGHEGRRGPPSAARTGGAGVHSSPDRATAAIHAQCNE